jgi:hypothetical protein
MVEYATKRWDQDRDRFDHVWCVADVDDYREDIDKAVRLASRAKISLVISNPCFEFWLLLHFTNHVAWLNDAAAAVAKVCRHVPSYDKTKLDFDSFAPGIHNAIDRRERSPTRAKITGTTRPPPCGGWPRPSWGLANVGQVCDHTSAAGRDWWSNTGLEVLPCLRRKWYQKPVDGATFDEAVTEMVAALREYADDWQDHLLGAPNHRASWGLVQLIRLSDDQRLRDWIVGAAR